MLNNLGSVMVWDFISREKTTLHYIVFIVALLMMLLGIYILASGDDILKILSVLFGVLLIVDGVHSAMHASNVTLRNICLPKRNNCDMVLKFWG